MRISLVILIALGALALAGCGSSTSRSASTATVSAAAAGRQVELVRASGDLFAARNATHNLHEHPENIALAKSALKPLLVAGILKVDRTNQVAGAEVTSLLDEVDGLVPGLTTQLPNSHLDGPVVNRFLKYASSDPDRVFKPAAAKAVRQLKKLLSGTPGNVSLGDPPETPSRYVTLAEQEAKPYWPDLYRRLVVLQHSLTG